MSVSVLMSVSRILQSEKSHKSDFNFHFQDKINIKLGVGVDHLFPPGFGTCTDSQAQQSQEIFWAPMFTQPRTVCVRVCTHTGVPAWWLPDPWDMRESRSSRDSGCLFSGFLGPPKANNFGCQTACPGQGGWGGGLCKVPAAASGAPLRGRARVCSD